MTRIKVNPHTGQVVVWEPGRTPDAPWFSVYAPDKRPGEASQFLFTDEDVKGWPDWMPITYGEYSYFAKSLRPGHHIRRGNDLLTVEANEAEGAFHRVTLRGRPEPLTFSAYSPVTVLMQKWIGD